MFDIIYFIYTYIIFHIRIHNQTDPSLGLFKNIFEFFNILKFPIYPSQEGRKSLQNFGLQFYDEILKKKTLLNTYKLHYGQTFKKGGRMDRQTDVGKYCCSINLSSFVSIYVITYWLWTYYSLSRFTFEEACLLPHHSLKLTNIHTHTHT